MSVKQLEELAVYMKLEHDRELTKLQKQLRMLEARLVSYSASSESYITSNCNLAHAMRDAIEILQKKGLFSQDRALKKLQTELSEYDENGDWIGKEDAEEEALGTFNDEL